MSRNIYRRIIAALILSLLITMIVPIGVYAESNVELKGAADDKMDAMGYEALIWYRCLLACCIPVLIVRYASYGFQLLGNTFMTKGEYSLDRIKKDIFYSSVAVAVLALLPQLLSWSKGMFFDSQWVPPSPSYKAGAFIREVFFL